MVQNQQELEEEKHIMLERINKFQNNENFLNHRISCLEVVLNFKLYIPVCLSLLSFKTRILIQIIQKRK